MACNSVSIKIDDYCSWKKNLLTYISCYIIEQFPQEISKQDIYFLLILYIEYRCNIYILYLCSISRNRHNIYVEHRYNIFQIAYLFLYFFIISGAHVYIFVRSIKEILYTQFADKYIT